MNAFFLLKNGNYYVIVNDDANFTVGCVHPLNGQQGPYKVTSSIGPRYLQGDVGFVTSLDDAIPAFINFYKNNPVPWEQESAALYWKLTMSVSPRVEKDQQGHWLAYRDDYPLLEDTMPARFATCADAQRAADAHELDLYPDAKAIDDGLSWLPDPEIDWRSVPHLAEERANWKDLIIWQSNDHMTTSSSI